MISSIIATNETLCYLLGIICEATGPRYEDTRYCEDAPGMMHSALYGKSRPAKFAEGNDYITVSNICSYGEKTGARERMPGRAQGSAPAARLPSRNRLPAS